MKSQHILFTLVALLLFSVPPVTGYDLTLTYTTIDNELVSYSAHGGTPLLIDAFATWCEPCKTTILHIKDIHKNLGDQVEILTISIDPVSDSLSDIEAWKQNFGADWTFGLDQDKELFKQFNLENLPSLLLFDEEGTLVKQWSGITQPSIIYSELNRQFGLPIPETQNEDNTLLVGQLLGNTGFQITIILTILAVSFVVISNVVNRSKE